MFERLIAAGESGKRAGKLEQRLRRAGLMRERGPTEAEVDALLGPGDIDAPLTD